MYICLLMLSDVSLDNLSLPMPNHSDAWPLQENQTAESHFLIFSQVLKNHSQSCPSTESPFHPEKDSETALNTSYAHKRE